MPVGVEMESSKESGEIFKRFLDNLDSFLTVDLNSAKKCQSLASQFYEASNPAVNPFFKKSPLSGMLMHLITEDFDDEQIWQQLEIRNDPLIADLVSSTSKFVSSAGDTDFGVQLDESHNESSDEDEGDDDDLSESLGSEDEDLDTEESDSQPEESEEEVSFKKSQSSSKTLNQQSKRVRKSIVDDNFFRLGDMEVFLEQEDAKEMKKSKSKSRDDEESSEDDDDKSIDYFEDIPSSDDEARAAKYTDFFDDPNAADSNKRNKTNRSYADDDIDEEEADEDDEYEADDDDEVEAEAEQDDDAENDGDYDLRDADDDDKADEANDPERLQSALIRIAKYDESDEDEEPKSKFEREQEKTTEQVKIVERKLLQNKPWQLSGEIDSKARPENSLLEEHVQFDHMTRQTPVITEETTKKLEDIIIQRIKDQAWDDVERKVKPANEVFEYRRRVTLDQEKSKQSLAQVYEQEYLNQQHGKKEEEEVPEHEEISKAMNILFRQLDALSNYHFAPKPTKPEMKVVSNLPSVAVEEVTPAAVGDGDLLAPEEVKRKPKHEPMARAERTKTDKNRERRIKKLGQRRREKFRKEKLEARAKVDPKVAAQLEKEKAEASIKKSSQVKILNDKKVKQKKNAGMSSTAFFNQLQDQVKNHINSKREGVKEGKSKNKDKTAAFIKL